MSIKSGNLGTVSTFIWCNSDHLIMYSSVFSNLVAILFLYRVYQRCNVFTANGEGHRAHSSNYLCYSEPHMCWSAQTICWTFAQSLVIYDRGCQWSVYIIHQPVFRYYTLIISFLFRAGRFSGPAHSLVCEFPVNPELPSFLCLASLGLCPQCAPARSWLLTPSLTQLFLALSRDLLHWNLKCWPSSAHHALCIPVDIKVYPKLVAMSAVVVTAWPVFCQWLWDHWDHHSVSAISAHH